ncbi:hypothetical protein Tco_1156921 [Tanacetum coccineum]
MKLRLFDVYSVKPGGDVNPNISIHNIRAYTRLVQWLRLNPKKRLVQWLRVNPNNDNTTSNGSSSSNENDDGLLLNVGRFYLG